MNRIIFTGRFTDLPTVKQTQGGIMCNFTIANNVYANGEEKTNFINCVAFGKTAETIEKYCNKGDKIAVEGQLSISPYEDKDGVKRTWVNVVVGSIEFMGSAKKEEEEEEEKPKSRSNTRSRR